MGTWLKASAHVTVTVQFMKHRTQYLFPLHSREKPVPYQWMHTVHLCLNTAVRGNKRSELLTCAARLLSPRLVLSVLPLWTMVLTGSTEKLLSYKKCFSSFVLLKEENAGTSLTLVTFKKKRKVFMQSHDV